MTEPFSRMANSSGYPLTIRGSRYADKICTLLEQAHKSIMVACKPKIRSQTQEAKEDKHNLLPLMRWSGWGDYQGRQATGKLELANKHRRREGHVHSYASRISGDDEAEA